MSLTLDLLELEDKVDDQINDLYRIVHELVFEISMLKQKLEELERLVNKVLKEKEKEHD